MLTSLGFLTAMSVRLGHLTKLKPLLTLGSQVSARSAYRTTSSTLVSKGLWGRNCEDEEGDIEPESKDPGKQAVGSGSCLSCLMTVISCDVRWYQYHHTRTHTRRPQHTDMLIGYFFSLWTGVMSHLVSMQERRGFFDFSITLYLVSLLSGAAVACP